MSREEIERMEDEGGHLSHREREQVLKRRFVRAATKFCQQLEDQKLGAGCPMLEAYRAWKHA